MVKRPNNKNQGSGHIIIVKPTLEEQLRVCNNPKEVADKSNMDLSNFRKSCQKMKNMRLKTYANCLSGFDQCMVIMPVPKKLLKDLASLKELDGEVQELYTIEYSDFLSLVVNQMEKPQDLLLSSLLHLSSQMKSPEGLKSCLKGLQSLREFCECILQTYGNK